MVKKKEKKKKRVSYNREFLRNPVGEMLRKRWYA
jgi:hypothetical protein